MDTPSITPAQYGAGGLFLSVALACIAKGTTGVDLFAYLGAAALVTVALTTSDTMLRRGRMQNADTVLRAKAVHALATTQATPPTPTTQADA